MKNFGFCTFKIGVFLLLQLITQQTLSQSSSEYQLPVVTPVSPDAAAIGKITEVPVSLYNGVPQIDIPFYNISYKGVQVPIGISYNASGIKVEEIASSVGMGWSLNAGGAISRIVRGIPDELLNGYISGQKTVQKLVANQYSESQRKEIIGKITKLQLDAEPDMFTLSLPGYSCKFFFDEDGGTHTIPESKTKIVPGDIGGLGFRSWTVTTSDGVKYELGATDQSELGGGIEKTRNLNSCQQLFEEMYNSWFLTRITPRAGQPITFEYDSYNLSISSRPSQTSFTLIGVEEGTGIGCATSPPDNCISTTTIFSKRLRKIIFNNGEVNFVEGADRQDVTGGKKTDEVFVINKSGKTVKKFIFYHSYRSSSSGSGTETQRLFLDSVGVFSPLLCEDAQCEVNPQVYKFQYNQEVLPGRSSTSQDYWGFYNGRPNGQFLIPEMTIERNGQRILLPGADRRPSEHFTKAGILEKVTYPTGGHMQLKYELNSVENDVPYFNTQFQTYFYSFPIPPPEDDLAGLFIIQSCDGRPKVLHGIATGVMVPGDPSNPSDNKQQWRILKWNPAVNDFTEIVGAFGSLTENNTLEKNIILDPGMYRVFLYKPPTQPGATGAPDYPATISLDWKNDVDCTNRPAGGLRVKETWLFDGINPLDTLITHYSYNKFDDPTKSSGTLANFSEYNYLVKDEVATFYQIEDELDVYIDKCVFYRRSSISNQPLASTGSSTVGYSNITVSRIRHQKNLGKTEYTFVTPDDAPDDYEAAFPFAPVNSAEWKRGILKKQVEYKSNATFDQFEPIQETVNSYASIGEFNYIGLKTGVDEGDLTYNFGILSNASIPKEKFFSVVSGFNYNTSSKVKMYDQKTNTRFMESESSSSINSFNYKINTTESRNSKNELMSSKTLFPVDYNTTTTQGTVSLLIKGLKESNLLDLPIETYSIRKDKDNIEWVESGSVFEYNGFGLPTKVYQLRASSPIQKSSFTVSSINSSGEFIKDSRYELVAELKYDGDGNVIEQFKSKDLHTRILWGYNNELPIAECANCADTVAYTSFELSAKGNWAISSENVSVGGVTGLNYYDLTNGGISKTNLTASNKYLVSYWSRGGIYSVTGTTSSKQGKTINAGGHSWTYFEHVVTGVTTVTVSGSGSIDELRLYPPLGMMSTYSHNPLLGISSKCDANSTIASFEYDVFGRLRLIRDQFGNTIKTFEYKFQVEQ